MILYYAVGGGLGHLTRARSILHTLHLQAEARVIASPVPGRERIFSPDELIPVPNIASADPVAMKTWLQEQWAKISPKAFYIDTFLAGIFGELNGFLEASAGPVYHIARLLQWKEYAQYIGQTVPRIRTTYFVERLHPDHESFLCQHSDRTTSLTLKSPPQLHDTSIAAAIHLIKASPSPWLIVHSGPRAEIDELISYAREMQTAEQKKPSLFVVTPCELPALGESLKHLTVFPASVLFPYAERIITGCGFNIMRETEPFRARHRFLPFPRKFDDQFFRAEQRRMGIG